MYLDLVTSAANSALKNQRKIKIFTKSKMNSTNGFQTQVWGTPGWVFLHCIAFNFPLVPTRKQKADYIRFFKSIGDVLPCKYCRMCYGKMVREGPLKITLKTVRDRRTFSKWVYKIHKAVTDRTTKKKTPPFKEVADTYNSFRASCSSKADNKAKGCITPAVGIKKKSRVSIYPRECHRGPSLSIHRRCKL